MSQSVDEAYKPPQAVLGENRAVAYKMYSPNQIGIAALLGSPLAGLWLMAANYGALERFNARMQAHIWGVFSTLLVLALAIFLPVEVPAIVMPLVYISVLLMIAMRLQGKTYNAHMANGGLKHSLWRVFGISIIAFIVVIALAMAIVYLMPVEMLPDF